MATKKLKATKTFRIGEYVVGGLIKNTINDDMLTIEFLDYFTKEIVLVEKININQDDAHRTARNFLEVNGTSYYADQVMKWITSKVKLNNGNHFSW